MGGVLGHGPNFRWRRRSVCKTRAQSSSASLLTHDHECTVILSRVAALERPSRGASATDAATNGCRRDRWLRRKPSDAVHCPNLRDLPGFPSLARVGPALAV